MNLHEQLQAIHEQVRTFVEQSFPEYHVTAIMDYSRTRSIPISNDILSPVEYRHFESCLEYHVEAERFYGMETLRCIVFVSENDAMRIHQHQYAKRG